MCKFYIYISLKIDIDEVQSNNLYSSVYRK